MLKIYEKNEAIGRMGVSAVTVVAVLLVTMSGLEQMQLSCLVLMLAMVP